MDDENNQGAGSTTEQDQKAAGDQAANQVELDQNGEHSCFG